VKDKSRRRSDRVSLNIPIWVSGTEVSGQDFREKTQTLSISREGATIVLSRKLASPQQVRMHNLATDKETVARVVGQIGGQRHGYVYGVAWLDPTENIWNIKFPPPSEADKAVARLLLVCTVCQTTEVAYLNELEVEVFEANRSLSRSCEHCNGWTVWKQAPPQEAPVDSGPSDAVPPPASPSAEGARTRNKRKDVRVPLKRVTACIRQPGFEEEVVRVENVSRGGLRFLSPNVYYEGSRIEVAVPYARGGANIFVEARIIRSGERPDSELKEYGVAYIRTEQGRG
jgi:PilZ domain-containing protein